MAETPQDGSLTEAHHPAHISKRRNNQVTKRTRGRLGCLNCRRRRKKCDETKPICSKCQSKGEDCEWDTAIKFRMHELNAGRHKVGQRRSQAPHQAWQMLDSCSADEHQIPPSGVVQRNPWLLHRTNSHSDRDEGQLARSDLNAGNVVHQITSTEAAVGTSQHSASSAELPPPALTDRNSTFTDRQLEPLDYLTSRSESLSAAPSSPFHNSALPEPWNAHRGQETATSPMDLAMVESPDAWAIYYPNAAYRELHTTLHNSIMETTRNTGFTRPCTQESSARQTPERDALLDVDGNEGGSMSLLSDIASLRGCPRNLNISQQREMELWANYLDEVAPWLDMFDNQRHFQHTLPVMAKSAAHLRLAILALSARQLERKNPNNPYVESLDLYQEAIRLIVQELHSMDTAVIASCVLLCVLEMMSSSPRDWSRHLDGCAIMLQTAGINGVIGGVRQAIFWCFARMDVWGGFLSGCAPKIPTNQWLEQRATMSMTVSQFRTSLDFDSYANYAVFLCASVLMVITKKHAPLGREQNRGNSYLAEWKAMFDLLEDWYARRPEKMQPLLAYPAGIDDPKRPFPIVVYGNASAVNGNTLYHTSALLMLQLKPKDHKLGKGHKSILWHARQICGISTSNNNHGAWINALQPLWIVGKVMSNPLEHKVILDLLRRIETETGWATSWRAQDLKDYWGAID